jgi:hypothetical protein
MIHESDISSASFKVRLHARATRAFERGSVVLVVPHDESKVFREVHFLSGGWVLCIDAGTREPCEANSKGKRVCYHVIAAANRRRINAKRRATLKRKKEQLRAA